MTPRVTPGALAWRGDAGLHHHRGRARPRRPSDRSAGRPGASRLAQLFLVGLPNAAVREARERVRTAIKNSGFEYPLRRITANLAPAELPKQGPSYGLPLAL